MILAFLVAGGLLGSTVQAPEAIPPPGSVSGKISVDQKLNVKGVKILESIVYLESDALPATPPDPSKPCAVIDQKNLTFVPRVTAIPAGGTVSFQNSDKELHNVLGRCFANRDFNNAVAPNGALTLTLPYEEVIVLGCNIHPDMRAYILVLKTSYFAALKEDGSYEIPKVPPGTYKVKVWNERFRTAVKEVSVASGKATTADFDFDSTQKVRYQDRDAAAGGGK